MKKFITDFIEHDGTKAGFIAAKVDGMKDATFGQALLKGAAQGAVDQALLTGVVIIGLGYWRMGADLVHKKK